MPPLWFQAQQLHFAYPKGPQVVRAVSLSVAQGTMTAVIGSNGSGKSTLIRMLAGLLKPQRGQISLDNIDYKNWEARLRARQVGYVPQSTATAFPFQVIDLVISGRTPHTSRFRFETAHDRDRAMESLAMTGGTHLAARPFTSLSGGEKQMVILARALAQEPRLLLLDEPSSSLDLKHRAAMIRTLAGLRDKANISIIMITHDLQLTGIFDQVLALKCGELAAAGTPGEILRDVVLREIYDDPNVHAQRMGDQTLVWVALK